MAPPIEAVRYIRVQTTTGDLFSPATRTFGAIAVIGEVTAANPAPPGLLAAGASDVFTDPIDARTRAPGPLGRAIALAFGQDPGPSVVYGIRLKTATDWQDALDKAAALPVQFVVLAGTALTAATGADAGPIGLLRAHVDAPAPDGMERMGVAMLAKGETDPGVIAGKLTTDRMVYVAHRSEQDVAAAVAGAIAGQEPHVSMLLKQVKGIDNTSFTPGEIVKLNNAEDPRGGPAGKGVVWLTDPPLIPGSGWYLGEGYTGDAGGKKYIDVVRVLDDLTFQLKAQLIRTVGTVRISRSGLRALVALLESVLEPQRRREVVEGYEITVPLLALLDKPQRTPAEDKIVDAAQTARAVEVLVSVDYAGAIHRLNITLKLH